MPKLTIIVPAKTSDGFGAPLNRFFKMVENVNGFDHEEIVFDFSKCTFLRPQTIVGVSVLAHELRTKGINVSFIKPDNQMISDYIDLISSPWGMVFNDAANIAEQFEAYNTKSYIPLICFPTGKDALTNNIREKLLTAIDTLLKVQIGLKGDMFQAVSYLLAELTQNVVDHSGSEKGIIFAQFYPSKNFLDVCIADFGKGLYQSYIDSEKYEPESDSEAINFAVYGKSTKDLYGSRGFGLSTSREMLARGLKGKFFLYSGSSFYIQTTENEEIIDLPKQMNLKGCYVSLRIPLVMDSKFSFYNYLE